MIRQRQALAYLSQHERMTRQEYARLSGVRHSLANQSCGISLDKGMIRRTGSGQKVQLQPALDRRHPSRRIFHNAVEDTPEHFALNTTKNAESIGQSLSF